MRLLSLCLLACACACGYGCTVNLSGTEDLTTREARSERRLDAADRNFAIISQQLEGLSKRVGALAAGHTQQEN